MKDEFGSLSGITVTKDNYKIIETVYMSDLDFFTCKQEIASWYSCHGLKSMKRLYSIDLAYRAALHSIIEDDLALAVKITQKFRELAKI